MERGESGGGVGRGQWGGGSGEGGVREWGEGRVWDDGRVNNWGGGQGGTHWPLGSHFFDKVGWQG